MADAPSSNPMGLSPSPEAPSALFPQEVIDVLNTDFLGFKMWHLLIVALILPSPVIFLVIFMIIPGFKEKVTGLIRNGIPGVYSKLTGGS
jgi:hypothetical protein